MYDILWTEIFKSGQMARNVFETVIFSLIFCNNFVTFKGLWPEKVGKWPEIFEKWPRKNPVIPRVCGVFGQKPTFFS